MLPAKFIQAKDRPKCPRHKDIDLKPEKHPTHSEGTVWFWRCSRCDCLYTPDVPGTPR